MDLFERAARGGYRFNSSKGLITTEDLLHLPLTSTKGASLDNVAKILNKEVNEDKEQSFVTPSSKNAEASYKLDLVKYIIASRQEEDANRASAADKAALNTKINDVIARKKDKALEDMSVEELLALRS